MELESFRTKAGSEVGIVEERLPGSQAVRVSLGSEWTWTLPEEGWWGDMSKHSAGLCKGVWRVFQESILSFQRPGSSWPQPLLHCVSPKPVSFRKSVLRPLCPWQIVAPHSPDSVLGSGEEGQTAMSPPGVGWGEAKKFRQRKGAVPWPSEATGQWHHLCFRCWCRQG